MEYLQGEHNLRCRRIDEMNTDFKDFIDLVGNYYETGRLRKKDWSKA